MAMKTSKVLVGFMTGAALVAASGLAFAATESATARKDVIRPADGLKWEDGPLKGVHVAQLRGDWMKGGPYEVLVKFDAGTMNPLHHHSQDLKIVVIS